MFDNESMSRFLRSLSIAVLLLLLAWSAGALAAVNPVHGYSVDLPVGWIEADNSNPDHIGFLSPNADAMVQIIALDPAPGGSDAAGSGSEIAHHVLDQLGAEGEPEPFSYQDRPAAISELAFTTGGIEVQGYLVTIAHRRAGFAILAFAAIDSYETAHDYLLSAIDSFSLDEESRLSPGPVSQYFYPFPAPNARDASIRFAGSRLPFAVDANEIDATEVLVDREARVLAPYGAVDREVANDAWRRYFRLIYRDNYMRLEPLSQEIRARLEADRVPRVDYPEVLLSWLQGFDYVRTGGLADFQPPVSCLATASGDCDSLAMTYAILLHHLGFDAILMVSDRYAHAIAAVDVQGPGARFAFEGRDWLVAELTADVPLGRIAAEMADPDGWLGVRLRLQ